MKKYIALYQKVDQYGQKNGYQLEIKDAGEITYTMKVLEEHQSSPNHCHGGVLAGLMDSTLGVASLTYAMTQKCLCSTVEFKINYLAPVHLGDELRAEGRLDHKGKTLVIASADIYQVSTGKRVCKGMGTFNLYPMEKKDFIKDLNL
ncbi:MAG: PaaI family thioesterase [Bacteriovoracaceae bacterium]